MAPEQKSVSCYRGVINFVDRLFLAPAAARLQRREPEIARWDERTGGYEEQTSDSKGSFNPPHVGHLAILGYLAKRYRTVHAVIGVNPSKVYDVTPEERRRILEAMLRDKGLHESVRVVVWTDLVWRYARSVGARVLCRGVRTWEQDGPSEKHLEIQNCFWPVVLACAPPMKTVYVEADARHVTVSSTLLRERIRKRFPVGDLVTPSAEPLVVAAYGR
eukprot:TRINITY_DN27901_c0_g1_i2.p1 TRINITY_DN27901_c0_g1~~TRINITY_DN27901_c0_g1_i2.p1  ORF type:complete len:238 (+),score=38.15 TRINITY_DN27901_c0_g1_i2:61-714(+)